MPKLPSLQFYPKDWLGDPVSWCSLAAQGLWLRMLFIMHDSGRYGHLCTREGSPLPPMFVAKACGIDLAQYETLLAELDAACVPSRNKREVIFSRRMLRDQERRKQYQQSKVNIRNKEASNRVHTVSTHIPHALQSSVALSTTNLKTKATAASAESPPLFRGKVLGISASEDLRLRETFPRLGDLGDYYLSADLWLETHPNRRYKRYLAFMRNWLARASTGPPDRPQIVPAALQVGVAPPSTHVEVQCPKCGMYVVNIARHQDTDPLCGVIAAEKLRKREG